MFRKECWIMYKAGSYGYKNGITVEKINKNKWIVKQYGKIVLETSTLGNCKFYIGYKYD